MAGCALSRISMLAHYLLLATALGLDKLRNESVDQAPNTTRVGRSFPTHEQEGIAMTPQELLGVIVRAFGILMTFSGLAAIFLNPILGALYFAAGIMMVSMADAIVRVACWSPRGRTAQVDR
jgi:hypothetical protein